MTAVEVDGADLATPTTSDLSHRRLKALTSLRFFAAAVVVVHHLSGGSLSFDGGAHGVAFFFALSGFILAYNYQALPSWSDQRRFLINRFARLWPAHVVGIVAVFLVLPELFAVTSWEQIISNLAMVQAWIPINGIAYSINGPSWSISTEFAFYLAFLFLIQDFRRTWWWKLAGTLGVAISLVVLASALRLPWSAPNLITDCSTLLYIFAPARLFEFTLGMCAAFVWRVLSPRIKEGSILLWTTIELAAVVLVAWTTWATHAYLGQAPIYYWIVSAAITIPALMLISVMALQRGWISAMLSIGPMVILGEISYSIYLLHGPIDYFILILHKPESAWLGYAACIASILVASLLTWLLVEGPARKLIRSFGRGRKDIRYAV